MLVDANYKIYILECERKKIIIYALLYIITSAEWQYVWSAAVYK